MSRGTLQVFAVLLVLVAIAVNTYFVVVLIDRNQTHHQESGLRFERIEGDLQALGGVR